MSCPFCQLEPDRIIAENEYALLVRDGYPVSPGHSLVIPKRHTETYFSLTQEELIACDVLLRELRDDIKVKDSKVKGFNIGINVGKVAGQTVFHCHIHLIPRREGDVDDVVRSRNRSQLQTGPPIVPVADEQPIGERLRRGILARENKRSGADRTGDTGDDWHGCQPPG